MAGLLTNLFSKASRRVYKEKEGENIDPEKQEVMFRIQRRLEAYMQHKQTLVNQNAIVLKNLIAKKANPDEHKDMAVSCQSLLTELIKMNGYTFSARIVKKTGDHDSITYMLHDMLLTDKSILGELKNIKGHPLTHEEADHIVRYFLGEHPASKSIPEFRKAQEYLESLAPKDADIEKFRQYLGSNRSSIEKSIGMLKDLEQILKNQSQLIAYEYLTLDKIVKGQKVKIDEKYATQIIQSFQEERVLLERLYRSEEAVNRLLESRFFKNEVMAMQTETDYSKGQGKRMLGVLANSIADFPKSFFSLRSINLGSYYKYPVPKLEMLKRLQGKHSGTQAYKTLEMNELSVETNQFVIVIERKDEKPFSSQEMRMLFLRLGYNPHVFLEDHRGEHMSAARNINGYFLKGENIVKALTSGKLSPLAWASNLLYGYNEYFSDFFLKRMAPGEDRRHIKFWYFDNSWIGTVHDDMGFFPIPEKIRGKLMFTDAPKGRTVASKIQGHAMKIEGDLDYLSGGRYGLGLYEFYTKDIGKMEVKPSEAWRDEMYKLVYDSHIKR